MSIGRNATYNVIGTVLPMLLALVTVPAYLHLIGSERYGVLAIAWLILGYFGVFDLGLGRAAAQQIAALRDATPQRRKAAFGTALVSNLVIGLVGAALMLPVALYFFTARMNLTGPIHDEIAAAAPLLALAVPIATTIGVLSGALMGRERFFAINQTSVISTSLFQLVPLLYAWLAGPDLTGLLLASIGARLIGLAMFWRHCAREFGADAIRHFDRAQLRGLLGFGGWVTVTGLFTPLLAMADRFIIGARLGAVAVTVYSVPTQITSRLSPVAGALGNAIFPRFVAAQVAADRAEANRLMDRGVLTLFGIFTVPVAAALCLMEPALRLWVGDAVGVPAAPVGRILLVTAWVNVFGQVGYWRLQAEGRPATVAWITLAEVPFYLAALYLLLARYGLPGAAIASLVRMIVDMAVLHWSSGRRICNPAGFCAAMALFAAEELALARWHPGLALSLGAAALSALVALGLTLAVLPRNLLQLGLRTACGFLPARRRPADLLVQP